MRHQQSESRYEAHLAQIVKRAGDEATKVGAYASCIRCSQSPKASRLPLFFCDCGFVFSEFRTVSVCHGTTWFLLNDPLVGEDAIAQNLQ